MKQFFIWLVVFLGLFAGLSAYYHLDLSAHPNKLLVAIDESYKMQSVSSVKIKEVLNSLKNRNYTQFGLITTKRNIHSWQNNLGWDSLQGYGPRDLENLLNANLYPQVKEANLVYILTNAQDVSMIRQLPHVRIIQLEPLSP
jgi:hypothetical protein